MSNLAEDLQTTTEVEVVAPSYKDSAGAELAVGDRVHVALSLAYIDWPFEPIREFDFGEVANLNEDGTVGVYWDLAGCTCENPDGRVENPADLTRVRSSDEELADVEKLATLIYQKGHERGISSIQRDLRDVLGIPEPTTENDN